MGSSRDDVDIDSPTKPDGRRPLRSLRMQLPPPADLPPGTVVAGRYRVVRRLGQGGMGVVFVAEHTKLERQVALKVLTPHLARQEVLVQRFEREARAASKIGHGNIINVLDFGRTDEGAPFIVMELLDGQDLGRAVRSDGAFPLERALRVMLQLCAGMSAAHAKGVIHRDLKPENVFLCSGDIVKVLDFGLARFADAQPLTQQGMVFGTPEYMAPEQARGERVDQRADVYAVGCILYELLTGSVPYVGADAATVIAGHLEGTLEPASRRAPHVGIPRALEGVIERALQKSAAARFASTGELAEALERAVAKPNAVPRLTSSSMSLPPVSEAPLSEAPPMPTPSPAESPSPSLSSSEGSLPPVPRRRGGLIVVAAIAVVGGGALAVALSRSPRTSAPPPTTPPAPMPVPVVAAPPTPPPPTPAREVTIDSEPSGADVFRGAERLGTTPLRYPLEADASDFDVTLSKRGWHPHTLRVSATGTHAYAVTLRAVEPHHSSPATAKPKPTASSSSPTKTPRELKDVFAD